MEENENVQLEYSQDTIPDNTDENTTDVEDVAEKAVTPSGSEGDEENVMRDTSHSAQELVSEKSDEQKAFVSVQYNHKSRDLSKQEAIELIQKGMHTESLRTKLEYLADVYKTDINTLVDKMASMPEKEHREHLEKLYGKDSADVEIGMEIYRQKQSDQYKKIMTERNSKEMKEAENKEIKSVNSRLADEYLVLKAELPNAPEYAKLPDSVIIEAANGKRDLLSSYLCHLNREKIKIDAAQKIQEAANNASTRSMKSAGSDNVNSQERSFLSGLWSK